MFRDRLNQPHQRYLTQLLRCEVFFFFFSPGPYFIPLAFYSTSYCLTGVNRSNPPILYLLKTFVVLCLFAVSQDFNE